MNKITTTIAAALVLLSGFSATAAPKKSILSLKESITDDAIVFPASFETDTRNMMQNWYLQNYAILDDEVESKDAATVSDAEYIARLKAIPSGVELPFNQVVRSYIERYITRERTMVSQMLGMSPYYMPIFEQALEKNGMPLELKYIPVIESALDPNAVSHAGASGLWQFMLETAKGVGLEVNSLVDERRDPYRSSEAAVKYFKQLHDIYGDWSLAIAAYNCGPGNVNKALRRASKQSEKPDFWEIYNYLPRETRGYVPAFIAATYVMTYYQKHNIAPSLAKKPLLIDTVQVNHRLHFDQIAKVLNIPIDEIRILNPQYRRDLIPGDTHPYTLALPSQQIYSFIMVEDSISSYKQRNYAVTEVREPGTANDGPSVLPREASQPTIAAVAAAPARESSGGDGGTKYHKVQRGESMRSIADDYGMSVDELMTMNNLKRKSVKRGQVLKVRDNGSQPQRELAQEAAPAQQPAAARSAETGYTAYRGSYSVNDEISTGRREPRYEEPSKAEPRQVEENAGRKSSRKAETRQQAADEPSGKKSTSRKARSSSDDEPVSRKSSRKSKKKEEPKTTTVTVKEGDSLSKIAKRNGVTVEQLREANPNIKGSHIEKGDQVKVPNTKASKREREREAKNSKKASKKKREQESKSTTVTAKSGDSMERIARHAGITVDELQKANPSVNNKNIRPGDKLKIPAKKSSSSKKSKKKRK